MKGIVDIEVGGKVRRLHFGTYMFMLCEEEGIKIRNSDKPISSIIGIIYNAAKAHCIMSKTDIDFTSVDVALWVDELGIDGMTEIIQNAVNVKSKNPEALKNQG